MAYDTTEDDLKAFFLPFGDIVSCKIPLDLETGRPRGVAFVKLADESSEQRAIAELDGQDLCGRYVRLSKAKPRPASP